MNSSLRIIIPRLMELVQEMYQGQEISRAEKDNLCRCFLTGREAEAVETFRVKAFFGSAAAKDAVDVLETVM